MDTLHVAVIFQNSLFAAGIASWLKESGFTNVSLMHISQADLEENLQALNPNVIIYDSSDLGVVETMCFFSLLRKFPGLQILQVDYQKEEVQIYYSQQKVAHEMGEFISLVQNITVPTD